MKIYLGTDHAGFELKEQIKKYLEENSFEVADQGAFALDLNDDYPDYMKVVAKMVQSDEGSRGIIFGGSGIGEAIVANRFSGVRAAVYYGKDLNIIKMTREHNNANVLSLGGRLVGKDEAIEAVKLFLTTPFSTDERHQRRINKIDLDINPSSIM